jgi:hypothetical protein
MTQTTIDTRTGDRHKSRKGDRHTNRPAKWQQRIIGCDGEGWGVDEHGRQNYMLMVAADETEWSTHLYTGSRLTTHECLTFLWELPTAHLTSYVFSYDASMIFRDIPFDVQNRIFERSFDWPPVVWEGWGIGYVGHKMLKITRYGKGQTIVYDAIGFWQQAYLKTVTDIPGIDPKLIELIKAGKARRGGEPPEDWRVELEYSRAECHTLALAQRSVYEACKSAGYPLSSFYGAGSLAKAMLRKHDGTHAVGPAELVHRKGESAGLAVDNERRLSWTIDNAYFGGRFETIGNGYLPRVYMADIRSAYPYAATLLPCLHNAKLRHVNMHVLNGNSLRDLPMGVWDVTWHCEPGTVWGPLPQRTIDGAPSWPMDGHTMAYTPEILAAARMPNVNVTVHWGYELIKGCDCEPFAWLHDTYRKRQLYKQAGDPREKVFKLGPNAVYGAIAQHVGKPKYRSLFLAGLITAYTRAKLLDAIRTNPGVIAVATDSIWSADPLHIDYGAALGEWSDEGSAEHVWLIQPGLAYSETDLAITKTRGIPKKRMSEPDAETGVLPWQALIDAWRAKWNTTETIGYTLNCQRYVGIGLAKNLNDPNASGRWESVPRQIRFGSEKRPLIKPSTTRELWRDSFPKTVGYEIYPVNRKLYIDELAELSDQPDITDSLTEFMAGLGA